MLGRSRFPAIGELPYMITLGPYGFYWFRLCEPRRQLNMWRPHTAWCRNSKPWWCRTARPG
ncbi:MAG: alpha-glucosidase C-terminal domain-containing protein [Rhodopseudomonas palustris]|nr:alpha-glucosidase C-terminal domain-containing protein [Rhodopseudomonas palustris]